MSTSTTKSRKKRKGAQPQLKPPAQQPKPTKQVGSPTQDDFLPPGCSKLVAKRLPTIPSAQPAAAADPTQPAAAAAQPAAAADQIQPAVAAAPASQEAAAQPADQVMSQAESLFGSKARPRKLPPPSPSKVAIGALNLGKSSPIGKTNRQASLITKKK